MRKFSIFLCFLLCLSLLLMACESSEPQSAEKNEEPTEGLIEAAEQEITSSQNGIVIKTEKEEYKVTDNVINVHIENESNAEFVYGEYFSIQKNINGVWHDVSFDDEPFQDVGILLRSNESNVQGLNLERLESSLSPGKYRVVKRFNKTSDNPTNTKGTVLAAPFKVIKE
ncbi:MAG TPA: immunoglobulin-like domain-containing protein [Chondromyces sp.]|nr:immunoglobulin-like domain-containing protein [Chondromyces sp.]